MVFDDCVLLQSSSRKGDGPPKPPLSTSEISIHIKYVRKFTVEKRKMVELAAPEFLSSPIQQLYWHKLPEVNILEQ